MTLPEIIAALEAAEGPSRELDAEIASFLVKDDSYTSVVKDYAGYDWCVRYYPGPPGPEYTHVPRYTSSIDAALTLMPKGWTWDVCYDGIHFGCVLTGPYQEDDGFPETDAEVKSTPATAIGSAALKARLG